MWSRTPPCPCPSGVSRDIPVVRIKVPQFDDDLEKLHRIGKDYTGPALPPTEKAEEESKEFVGPYVPMPYTFRLGCGPPQRGQHARNPPLWLLIDHTLAVIWCLFSPNKNQPIGVAQLQWALAFLSGIKNPDGENPADVKVCIEAIKNRLFTQYADVEAAYADKQVPCGLHICDPCYVAKSKSTRESRTSKGLSTIREETSKHGLDAETQKPFICPSAEKQKPIPVSATINSVLKSHSPSVHQLYKAGSSTINKPSDEAMLVSRQSAMSPEMPLAEPSQSPDEVLDFLSKWHADQVERVEGEMSRLQSIEALMKNVDSGTTLQKKKGL